MTSVLSPQSQSRFSGGREVQDPPDSPDCLTPDRLRRHLSCRAGHAGTYCAAIETEAEFQQLAPLWRVLHAGSPAPSPFASWEWAWQWWQFLGRHPRDGAAASRLLVVAVLTEAHELIGLFPFHFPAFRDAFARPAALRPLRSFGFLGKHHEGMTEEPVQVTKPGEGRRALESALGFLLRRLPRSPWDSVECWAQHSEETLMAAPPGCGSSWSARHQHRRVAPVMEVALPPTWEGMRASLSKSMRDNLHYYPRLLARHGHPWEVSVAETAREVAQEVEGLVALHRRREGARHGEAARGGAGGHLPSAAHRCFLQEALPALAGSGDASVAVLRVNGQRVAAQALLRRGETVLFYYSGFDPEWGAYSPLTVLHAEVFAFLLRRGVPRAGLLADAQPWKTRWGARPSAVLQQLSFVRPHPASLARLLLYARQKKAVRDEVEDAGRRTAL